MGTPERTKNNRIANSLTTFEDSPVFSYLNGLSPIKPVKSIPFTQTINPLTFATLQSVFTSPHASSLKECRFLQRHQLSDPSRPEFSWNTVNENKASANADSKLDDSHKENIDPTPPNNGEVSNMPSYGECSELIVELLRNPEHVPEDTSNSYHTSEGNLDGVGHVDQNKGSMSSSNWVSLISNPSQSSVDPATSFYTSIKHVIQQNTLSSGDMDFGNLFAQPEEESDMMGNNETHGMNGGSSIPNPSENMDYQHLSGLYSGVSRRCLIFNKDGARAKHLANYSTSGSCIPENDSSPVLPIIGLHLNALTATPKDYNNANIDSSISRRSLISADPFASLHRPPTCSGHELLGTTLTNIPLQRKFDNINDVVRVEDSCRESGCMESEDINPSSPKKKRRRLEQAGEGEGSCKRCNCKKSKCLKLYCECFAAGVYCVGPCSCVDCFNKPAHEDTVLSTRKQIESRNPLAFAPKVIRGSDSIPEIGDDFSKTPASARHKRGCNCKKSGCLKKYCECYQGGVGCSINCRCEGCKNAFGTKDGSGVVSMAHEFEEDETNATEKAELNRSFQKTTIQDKLEHTIDSALTATPLSIGRHLAHSFSSSKKSTHLLSSSSSSSFPASQGFGNPSMFPPPPKFRQLPETVEEDVMPEFLLECSSNRITQLPSSPNGKRVSPPKICLKRSPGRRSSRKLILQSIPSFPSLAHNL